MNIKLKLLFKQLNEYRSAGVSPDAYTNTSGYFDIQKKILAEISVMSSEETIGLIDELSDTQIKQIVPLVEYIIKIHPQTRFVFKNINEERNIYCCDKVDIEQPSGFIIKEPFDYTRWQKDLFADMRVRELSNAAMKAINEQQ